jgi:hypothetical protein
MPVDAVEQQVVDNLFKAMQLGPGGEEFMMSLFADDAVFIEPFSGEAKTHEGFEAIREAFRDSWKEESPPDMKLILDRADRDGDRVRADWTCTSPVFPAPMKGYDLFTIRGGKIARLEIVMVHDG